MEQLLEDIIESKGAANTVGVVFVDRRITALALYDYFRNRRKDIEGGSWVRVKDTKFNRQPEEDPMHAFSLEKVVESGKKKAIFDITTSQFQDTPFDIEDVENSFMCKILQETLPGVDLEALIADKSPDESPESDNDDKSSLVIREMKKNANFRKIRCDMIVRQCTQVFKYLDKS